VRVSGFLGQRWGKVVFFVERRQKCKEKVPFFPLSLFPPKKKSKNGPPLTSTFLINIVGSQTKSQQSELGAGVLCR